MQVLVTGGAGYIGSHAAKALSRAGIEPVVFDNLSAGHRQAVKWGPFVQGDLSDRHAIKHAIQKYDITAAIHFAAHAYVGESVCEPRKYFQNNVAGTLNLLEVLLDSGIDRFVFSSSCAVYGVPGSVPISEDHPRVPINPYGESKLFIERVLDWYARAYDFRWAALRYFNAAGADPSGELGELHHPETHLLPTVIEAALGQRDSVQVFGMDYPTPDGTAVRDFVHVSDLAAAHVAALEHLVAGADSFAANLGSGRGVSVREIVAAVERIAGVPVNIKPMPRRPGDPPVLIADPARAATVLDWRPKLCDLDTIVSTAWHWHSRVLPADPFAAELPVPAVGLAASSD